MAYTKEQKDKIFNTICERISKGETLRDMLENDKDIFSNTIWLQLIKDEDKNTQYAHAREIYQDSVFSDMLKIADTPIPGKETTTKANGDKETKEGDMLGHRKLQIDTRKWQLSKLNPKKYGDKTDITTDGEKIGQSIILNHNGKDINLSE